MFNSIILLVLSMSAFSQVSSGDKIKATEYSFSTFRIGDIKTSVLDETSFNSLHGGTNCWKMYNPASGDVDILGTDLGTMLTKATLHSASGRVLRAKGGLSEVLIGDPQEDALQGHRHRQGGVNGNSSSTLYPWGSWNPSGSHVEPSNSGEGNEVIGITSDPENGNAIYGAVRVDEETRMKNVTVNMYIRVNHSCE